MFSLFDSASETLEHPLIRQDGEQSLYNSVSRQRGYDMQKPVDPVDAKGGGGGAKWG